MHADSDVEIGCILSARIQSLTTKWVAGLVKQRRKELGLSQEEVAAQAQVSIGTYSALERGRSLSGGEANPTLQTLVRIFLVLGIRFREDASVW
ncbi:helix-turn-helix transcriptional regulator [Paramicrobacterium sp. CJ85]|uniref:helix-turn-helix transcriptional regulator n=1 Tax=Paramicrobacterium sp. CJ85 TaxID=3445355 RepID=UPI003F62FB3D